MNALDSSKYFSDPKVATFVDDVQRGDLSRVSAALKAGIDPNAKGSDGFRPVHFVFAAKTADVAKALLAAGADPNARIANGNTPLHYAVQAATADFTAVLLQYRADAAAAGASNEPVLFAALSSPLQDKILPMLVKAGADVNLVWGGYSPLQAAMVALRWGSAATLLALNADPNVRSTQGENAAATFCDLLKRLQPTATNRDNVLRVGEGLKGKGAALACENKLGKFR